MELAGVTRQHELGLADELAVLDAAERVLRAWDARQELRGQASLVALMLGMRVAPL